MRLPVGLTIGVTVTVGAILIFLAQLVLTPERPLIAAASFNIETISPNADGVDDITLFSYEITDNALVSMDFTAENGDVYVFRENERRAEDEYSVLFSGVVDGFLLEGETVEGEVMRRLIPDGVYNWRLTAVAQDDGETAEVTGVLTVTDADSPLPLMTVFSVGPRRVHAKSGRRQRPRIH